MDNHSTKSKYLDSQMQMLRNKDTQRLRKIILGKIKTLTQWRSNLNSKKIWLLKMAVRMEGYKGSRMSENGGFWRISYERKMAEAKYRMVVRDNYREWWIDLRFDSLNDKHKWGEWEGFGGFSPKFNSRY